MGSRRTQELSAVAAARAAYIAGFEATSNLEAGRRYGVPTTGTSAHAFTLLHDRRAGRLRRPARRDGRRAPRCWSTPTTSTRRSGPAVELTDGRLGAVRLDSGDLALLARQVRALLDSLGATATKIIVTSDLDEWNIAALSGAPVDGYGVGTALVTGWAHPTCGFVYKLVARATSTIRTPSWSPVAKKSTDKISVGGRKYAVRRLSAAGVAEAEVIGIGAPPSTTATIGRCWSPLVRDGEIVGREPLTAARERHCRARAELPLDALKMSRGEPVIETLIVTRTGPRTPTSTGPELRNRRAG